MFSGLKQLDGVNRRAFLEYTAKTMLGVTVLPGALMAADTKTTPPAKADAGKKPAKLPGSGTAKNVIFLYMGGAMTHLDTFDLKPGRETQGETKGIATKSTGMQISEFLPGLAKASNHLAIVRLMFTETGDHEGARYFLRTSYKEIATIRHPGMGAWAMRTLGVRNKTLPDNVLIGPEGRHPGAGFLEPTFTPVPIGNPNAGLQNTKLPKYLNDSAFEKRMNLVNQFDAGFRSKYPQKQVEAYTEFYKQASTLIHSKELEAFDLSKEKQEARDKYGMDSFGQGCLLARRLVEQDVRYIEVSLDGWDMHTDIYQNKIQGKAGNLDKALSALIADLESRGLLKTTLIALGTEFGRTPRINQNNGRDHHPAAFSGLFAGGGIKGGRFWGSSDKDGHGVDKDPVSVADFNATIGYALGLPLAEEFFSKSGRPFKVAHEGKPLTKLFS